MSWSSEILCGFAVIVTENRLHIGHSRFTHSYLTDHTDPAECTECHHLRPVKHILIESIRHGVVAFLTSVPDIFLGQTKTLHVLFYTIAHLVLRCPFLSHSIHSASRLQFTCSDHHVFAPLSLLPSQYAFVFGFQLLNSLRYPVVIRA